MTVVSIDTPGPQYTLHIAIVSRSPHMIHHFVTTTLNNGGANFSGKRIQHLIPCGTLPSAFAALALPFERIQNAFRVIDLVDGGWSFRAVTPATTRMIGITLKAFDAPCFFVNIGEQAASCLAVEADGRDNLVVLLSFARPNLCVIFHPVMPAFRGWTGRQVSHRHWLATRCNVAL